jgi:hypothetical protein
VFEWSSSGGGGGGGMNAEANGDRRDMKKE